MSKRIKSYSLSFVALLIIILGSFYARPPKGADFSKRPAAPKVATPQANHTKSYPTPATKPQTAPAPKPQTAPAPKPQPVPVTKPQPAPAQPIQAATDQYVNSSTAQPPQSNAVKDPAPNAPKARWHQENLNRHWEKHGAEFPEFRSAKEYGDAALNFFANPPKGTLTKTRENGEKLYYHPPTNTFGAAAPDGTPKTLFRPSSRINYWNRQ